MTPDNALQAAVYTRLSTHAPLTAYIGADRVFDFVQPGLSGKYVVIGDDTAADFSTKTEAGFDLTLTLHCWDTGAAGRKSVKTILGHIHDALHRQEESVTLTGFHLTELRFDGFQTTVQETASEGESDHFYHGLARYRALIEPL